jgi:hypothetical protein
MVEGDDEIKLPKLNLNIQKDRFKFFGVYKVDTWLTTGAMVLLFAYFFFVAYHYNFSLDYYSCAAPIHQEELPKFISDTDKAILTGPTPCKNPFYKPTTWVNYEYLAYGEYGTKPGPLFKSLWPVTFGLFAVVFLLNHLIYNRKKKGRKSEVPIVGVPGGL